jgi:iron(III) transport system substrate-binding protein
VVAGELAFGWAGSDLVHHARADGAPLAAVYPDQEGVGTLFLPGTVAILKDAPNADGARQLVDWMLTEEVERELVRAGRIPLRADIEPPAGLKGLGDFRPMAVSYISIGKQIVNRARQLNAMFRL